MCGLLDNIIASCEKSTLPQDVIQELADSVKFDSQTGILSFTAPNEIPEEYVLWIHISGRLKMDDNAMSFHAFEEESYNKSWELGKTYTYEIGKDALLEGFIDVGLIEKGGEEVQYGKLISIDENGTISMIEYDENGR